jgi:undecaprenyl-diphosphatase
MPNQSCPPQFWASPIPAYGVAMLIGLSRVYNGVHYPSDVIIGALMGIVSAIIGINIIT